MAYRFTNTEKWQDGWFSELSQLQMLLFLYLCDNCDIAGFIEINIKRWAVDLNSSKETIEGALKGLQRGLFFSPTNDCLYIRNFLKHQKNYPLNEKNLAHRGILKRFELYAYKFNIEDVTEFIEGASKGLNSPIGNGNGNGNGNGLGNGEDKPKKFLIPSLEQVISYCKERNNLVDPQKWFDYYTANGWKVGKNQMKNWQAAVRTWERNNISNGTNSTNNAAKRDPNIPSGNYNLDWDGSPTEKASS